MRKRMLVCLFIIIIMSIVGNVSAQEAVASQQADGVIGIERDVFVGICIALAILVQGVMVAYLNKNPKLIQESYIKLLEDRAVRTAAEHAYMTSSLPVQEFINILRSGVLVVSQLDVDIIDDMVDPLADFMEDITDGVDDEGML